MKAGPTVSLAAGETLTASPRGIDGKVLGNAGDDSGARSWIAALDGPGS